MPCFAMQTTQLMFAQMPLRVITNEKEENIQLKKEIDWKAKRRWNLFIVKTFSAVLERKLQLNRFLPLLKGKRVKEEKQNRSNEIFPFLFEQS